MIFRSGLPIDSITDALCAEIGITPYLIVSAATGSGKSTVLPLAIHSAHPAKHIIMLEPRRIAARAAAVRMAHLSGEKVGFHVGFRTRFESMVSADTIIEVVTEGVFIRILQENPSLDGYDIVLFDEYHERTLQGDLALTLTMESIQLFRPDLTLIIMSATLDTDSVAKFFGGKSKVFYSPGKMFDVEVRYRPPKQPFFHPQGEQDFLRHTAAVIADALRQADGDVLVFLPGEAEIQRLSAMSAGSLPVENCEIMELYGNLPPQKQDAVFTPHAESVRRVILATPVAETSITIPGIRIVIDSGLARKPFFSPATGIDKLRTVRISKASAEQRKGRAGRTASGICYRLWSMQEQNNMEPENAPEIIQTDLAVLVLETAKWGVPRRDVLSMRWATPPPDTNLACAYDVLADLGAVSSDGLLTEYGRKLSALPVHPRIAHACMFSTESFGSFAEAIQIAALIGEKELLPDCRSADLGLRLAALDNPPAGVNRDVLARVKQAQTQIRRALRDVRCVEKHNDKPQSHDTRAAIALAAAFPDRIARRRAPDSCEYVLSNGVTAHLRPHDSLQISEYLVIADLGGIMTSPTIFSALSLHIDDLRKYLPHLFRSERILQWNPDAGRVQAIRITRIGSITLERKQDSVKDDDDTSGILLNVIRKKGFDVLPISKRARMLLARMRFLANYGFTQFNLFAGESLLAEMESWLAPYLPGMTGLQQLEKISFYNIFAGMLSSADRILLQREAPEFFRAPSGSNLKIDYPPSGQPLVHVKLQELFGLARAPKLAAGRASISFDLLSPAGRTVQITDNIDAFWDGSYALVRKDMRARYPKHNWPEHPREEPPSRSTIKRK